ncbi:Similar to gi/2911081 F7J7.180 putative protein from Arabidopsis thaliana BAC gb/AL021960 [Arabidopsis thaliana]|uniref:T2K10.13 protein n=1 Tax=Arabidopsis thaliana TaxID=3702 RepID=Q9ZUI5_ARATH|nr:Similar to gi/2911081 F7J7.180 putative protein from Arabidopsis thaliana BAC gb/AL021960 [Arabidopsis thaliana]
MDRVEEEAEDREVSIQSKEDESFCKFLEMIPLDLIPDILLRLPAKSAARSFASQSSTRLCLLVCVKTSDKRIFCAMPQHENPDRSFWNPIMRQHVTLPKVAFECSSLGYDPVEGKYKVLCISCSRYQDPLVFTLGPQESWRVTQNTPKHVPLSAEGLIQSICINGEVYYEASIPFGVDDSSEVEKVLMSFDVRYEKFNTIRKSAADNLLCKFFLNYEGKFAWDEEKQERSLRKFPQRDPIWKVSWGLRAATTSEAIYVLYYDPKRTLVRRVKYDYMKELVTKNSGSLIIKM